jgi:hypothetical protein
MITLRRRHALGSKARTLIPALAFLGFATLSAAGGGAVAALCLLPAGLVLEIGSDVDDRRTAASDPTDDNPEREEEQRHA